MRVFWIYSDFCSLPKALRSGRDERMFLKLIMSVGLHDIRAGFIDIARGYIEIRKVQGLARLVCDCTEARQDYPKP